MKLRFVARVRIISFVIGLAGKTTRKPPVLVRFLKLSLSVPVVVSMV